MEATEVELDYTPRPQQQAIHDGMDTHRFGAVVCHRRFGKTVGAVNHGLRAAVECRKQRPRFAYIGPTYRQAKASAWDYLVYFSSPIPGIKVNTSELRIDHPNGFQVRLFGADNPDSLRGLYFDGVIFDEYGLMPPNVFSEVVRPALADRGGWALFMGTPAGKNQFYDVVQQAKLDPSWFYAEYKASQTGLISPGELAAARAVMTQDEYDQEFECSFEASVKGAIYAKEMSEAREAGRITTVPYTPELPVDTDWDLGIGDTTAIWFSQSLRSGEIRLIDYYENAGEGLPHYVSVLNAKGYSYGVHWAPHDIRVRELGSGRSRLDTAAALGVRFQVVQQAPIEEGIHAARLLLGRCWFDAKKTQPGIEALMHYRRTYNSRLEEFTHLPVHDFASHGADAFRGLAIRHRTPPDSERRQALPRVPAMPQTWMG